MEIDVEKFTEKMRSRKGLWGIWTNSLCNTRFRLLLGK